MASHKGVQFRLCSFEEAVDSPGRDARPRLICSQPQAPAAVPWLPHPPCRAQTWDGGEKVLSGTLAIMAKWLAWGILSGVRGVTGKGKGRNLSH